MRDDDDLQIQQLTRLPTKGNRIVKSNSTERGMRRIVLAHKPQRMIQILQRTDIHIMTVRSYWRRKRNIFDGMSFHLCSTLLKNSGNVYGLLHIHGEYDILTICHVCHHGAKSRRCIIHVKEAITRVAVFANLLKQGIGRDESICRLKQLMNISLRSIHSIKNPSSLDWLCCESEVSTFVSIHPGHLDRYSIRNISKAGDRKYSPYLLISVRDPEHHHEGSGTGRSL